MSEIIEIGTTDKQPKCEDLKNLAGFLDILIQIDLNNRNKQSENNEK